MCRIKPEPVCRIQAQLHEHHAPKWVPTTYGEKMAARLFGRYAHHEAGHVPEDDIMLEEGWGPVAAIQRILAIDI